MNLVARLKPSIHLVFPSHPTGRPLRITGLQQFKLCSTGSRRSQQLAKSGIRKSSESRSSFSRRNEKQQDALTTVWPRPGDMPYEAKFANVVNLIGYVALPVWFGADPDGKIFSVTEITISLGTADRKLLSIPLVFEGELAHVVACHVKENDCVFVSGRLSVDSIKIVSSESFGKFHVVAESLSYVEEFGNNSVDEKLGFSNSSVKIDEDGVSTNVFSNQLMCKACEGVNANVVSEENCVRQSLNGESKSELPSPLLERGNAELVEKRRKGRSRKSAGKNKDGENISGLWRDLVRNPLHWWDYRDRKANGLVKENFPDFKQKETGESLWIKSAPSWVLPGLGKLACDVKGLEPKQDQGGRPKRIGKNDQAWRSLGENPDKWWDNRMNKRNPRAPDFKHKETGEALWLELDSSPLCIWALSMKGGQNTNDGKSTTAR